MTRGMWKVWATCPVCVWQRWLYSRVIDTVADQRTEGCAHGCRSRPAIAPTKRTPEQATHERLQDRSACGPLSRLWDMEWLDRWCKALVAL